MPRSPQGLTSFSQAWLDKLLEQHTPSLSKADEAEIEDRMCREEPDIADFALRTCSCGERIDGFYGYVEHLRDIA